MTPFVVTAVLLVLVAAGTGWLVKDCSAVGAGAFAAPFAFALVVCGLALAVPGPGACQPTEQSRSFAMPATGLLTEELKIRDARDTQIALGSSPGPARATIGLDTGALTAPPADPQVVLSVDSFRRDDNPQVLAAVHAYAVFTGAQRITVYLCVERGRASADASFQLDPGIYTGVLTVTDPRLPTTAIPFTVTLAYPNEFWPLLPWCGVLFVGAAYLAVIRRDPNDGVGSTKFGFASIVDFLGQPLGIAATIAGGGAALGVYVSSCLTNPTWATSTSDWLGLTAGMFGAFVAAGTAFRFANALDTRSAPEREQAADPPQQPLADEPASPEAGVLAGRGNRI